MNSDDVSFREEARQNERLRKAVSAELESTRVEMTALVAELASARDDARSIAAQLVDRDIALDELRARLAETQAAATSAAEASAETIAAQKRHIDRLKKQLSRPVRILAKRALGRGHA